ncbi:hypothetical protein [Nakamurella multipartita]|uniref:Integral membrane protein n=1 Tax=Nakamurella multipartita (strain ATCC 700099 / DSM 44233 / CIP 104796 / JCM 9543 / NBRC 105858 / Y-104) TaxID=479431 RepID=C8XEF7_NAKMY|nr:hypothetical protein [Nakamurella multipartita]ACV77815.1 hypothetical protein Namu_1414 [Nakamurella multipartita DSM 44233]HOZ58676.1 hypothetical protein [Nakamurella multipartita]
MEPDPPPLSIPPPGPVRAAAGLVLLEALGLLALAGINLVSGLSESLSVGRTLAQVAYYLVIAAALVLCATGLLRGRRWARTPSLVAQIVVFAIGVWLIAPSGQLLWGPLLVLVGGAGAALLLSKPTNAWISRFPLPFAEPDR